MKSTAWTIVLLALTFAIGWTSRVVAERRGAAPAEEAVADSDDGTAPERRGGDRRRGGRRGSRFGRFLESVQTFSEELALTSNQETALQALVDATLVKIREHEDGIRDCTEDARPKLREILTGAQRTRLDELVEARFRQRSEQKVQATLAWARAEFALDDGRTSRLEEVLLAHEDEKRSLFSWSDGREGAAEHPSKDEMRARMAALREALSEQLAEILDDEQREQLLDRSSGGRRFGKGRDLVE